MGENTQDDFFGNAPEAYEVPKSEGRYMKFKAPGAYKFRILEKPVFGHEGWKVIDGKDKSFRFKMDEKPEDTSAFKNGTINHFWAMPVYNFNTEQVEVLQINQKGIQQSIEALARNTEWGSPLTYNLTVNREGTGRDDTKYITVSSPHNELPAEAKEAWEKIQAEGFNINELFVDGEPFKPSTPAVAEVAPVAETAAPEAEIIDPTEKDVPDAAPMETTTGGAVDPA